MRIPSCFVSSIFIISLLASCTSSTEKKARSDFQRTDALVAAHELSTAMQLLDSMMIWNKDDYGIVGEALRRKIKIALDYHKGVIETSEALLNGLESRLPTLTKDFQLIPGEPGQPGTYEHKRQTVEFSWNRTFLKIGLNENGDVWLISHYYGKFWIDHTSLRVYDQDNYILTDTIPLGHEWNRKVEDLGDRWETIEFREGSDAGAIAFIAGNYQKSVKVRLTGKIFHYIVLESYDKEAIRKGLELAHVLKERSGLRQTIMVHQAELRKLGVATGSN
ncbi:MAG: hypothetical protein D4R64_12620 [Porphyromonadaceae bacterium]|nr:MAG: hypothetical protein D4R64_12620 [Porphyromonadaceae bacterium]